MNYTDMFLYDNIFYSLLVLFPEKKAKRKTELADSNGHNNTRDSIQ